MIKDYEEELTLAGGHALDFAAGSEYGSRPFDKKVPGAGIRDPAIGEPLNVMCDFTELVDNCTSIAVALVADDDGAGNNEVVLVTKTFLLATIDGTGEDTVRRVGIVSPGAMGATTLRYLTAKLTVAGTTPTVGKVTVWIQKGADTQPANAANVL